MCHEHPSCFCPSHRPHASRTPPRCGCGAGGDPLVVVGFCLCRSVPSGRVGLARESTFRSNDQFREAVMSREMQDIQELESKMQRK